MVERSSCKESMWKGEETMIYLTGDCHREFERLNSRNFPEQKEMTKEDYVIICGDFGGVWSSGEESKEETWILDWLESKPFTTLFVDGNHENFDRLCALPEERWQGGKIHRIRPSVIHLMRGQIFELQGKTFFTFGGASSHDIGGGILEPDDPEFRKKKKALDREWIAYRINHQSWWKEELPSEEELQEGRRNLKKRNHIVDFIVTHCCADSILKQIGGGDYQPDFLTSYLEEIRQTVQYRKWFFGHYHENRNLGDKEILIYEQIIRIS